jgi:uncharacterized protein YydD (DUF2326 family)
MRNQQEVVMIGGNIANLLQEASKIKEAMEKIGDKLPAGISIAELEAKINALKKSAKAVDAINAERTQMVNVKADDVTTLNEYLIIIRLAIKSLCGLNSSEYEMVGGTRASERKKPVRKPKPQA